MEAGKQKDRQRGGGGREKDKMMSLVKTTLD